MLESVCRRATCSDLLEKMATDGQRSQGLDIADFLLMEDTPQMILARMIEHNPVLQTFIDTFGLEPALSFGNLRRKFGSYGQEKTAISDIRKHDSVFTGSDMNISKDMAHAEAAQSNQETMAAGNVESGTDSGSSIGSGIVGAAIELIVQPHQAPETGGGGGGSSDDNKRDEEKDKYVPRKGRRR